MRDRHAPQVRGQGRGQRGERIAVHQHAIGPFARDRGTDRDQHRRKSSLERPFVTGHAQILVRHDPERPQHLVQQLAMLPADQQTRVDARLRTQRR